MAMFRCGGGNIAKLAPDATTEGSSGAWAKSSSNNVYLPPAGSDGYSQVTVKPFTKGEKITITSNGDNINLLYSPVSGESGKYWYAYSTAKVAVPNTVDDIGVELWKNDSGIVLGNWAASPSSGDDVENHCTLSANTNNKVNNDQTNKYVDLRGINWSQYKYLWIRTKGPLDQHTRTQSDSMLKIGGSAITWGYPTYQHSAVIYGSATSSTISFSWYSQDSGNNGRPLLTGIWGYKG